MRKVNIIISICCFVSLILNAQTFTVGSTCCNYVLVNKTFSPFCNPPFNFIGQDSFPIDITGDLFPDLVIRSECMVPSSASGASDNCIFVTSQSNVESVVATTFTNTLIIDNLLFGSTYNTSLNWDTLPRTITFGPIGPSAAQKPVVYEYWHRTLINTTVISGTQTNPFYIVFRKVLPSTDTIYGWIRMDSNFPGKIFDYAYTCGTYTGTPPSSTITTSSMTICKADSVFLNATPSGGIFSGAGVSSNYFKSKNLSFGSYTINYLLPNPIGCSNVSSSITFTVNSCVGIHEIKNINSVFSIFPNPNSGEFEIKGVKEETIFISNELGQLIETKNLNAQNNYSVKINNLQNGIYFVGNAFSRQKIVVIK